MLIIGESINSTIPEVGKAINSRDESFIAELAQQQVAAGAGMLDVNVAVADGDEVENLLWAIRTVQSAVEVPLVLDTGDPDALKAGLEAHRGRPIINSITGEERKLAALLPLAVEHNCGVILLCLDDHGIPKTPEGRCEIAKSLVDKATRAGVATEDLYVDPLILTVGADSKAARVALDTLRLIHDTLPGVHTSGGVTNVSFGMPQRSLLNRTFLAMTMALGMDTFLVNVRDKGVMATICAANALLGNDPYCSEYLEAYHAGKLKVR